MTVTWVGDTCTLSAAATHTTNDIVTDAGAPAGANLLLSNGGMRIYAMRDVRVVIEAGSVWADTPGPADAIECVWVFHEYSGTAGAAVELQGALSSFIFGDLLTDSADAPVTARGCGYWFATTDPLQNWTRRNVSTGGNGIFNFYGGMFQQITTLAYDVGNNAGGTPAVPFGITGGTSGATAQVTRIDVNSGTFAAGTAAGFMVLKQQSLLPFQNNETLTISSGGTALADGVNICPQLFMPSDTVRIYQANMPRYGGIKFFGTNISILESKFKRSPGAGFTFDGAGVSVMRKVEFTRNAEAFSLGGSGSQTVRGASLRGNTVDVVATSFTGTLTLVDSDDIATGSLSFTNDPSTNNILEQTSYNLVVVDDAGVGLNSLVGRAVHRDSYRAFGIEVSSATIDGQAGTMSEFLCTRARYDTNNTTPGTPLDFGGFLPMARGYGRQFFQEVRTPGTSGISEFVPLPDNPFTILGTGADPYSDDIAVLLTGVAIVDAELDTLGSATTLAFNDNGASADTIVRSTGSFLTDGFEDDMVISVWDSDGNDDTYFVETVTALTLTLFDTETLVTEAAYSRPVLRGYIVNITTGTANTLNLIYSKLQSIQSRANGTDSPEMMFTADGQNYALPRASVIRGLQTAEIDFQGGTVIRQDLSSRLVPVVITGVVAGSVCEVLREDNNESLGSATSTGTTVTVVTLYPGADLNVSVRVRLAGRVPFNSLLNLPNNGINVAAVHPVDPNYTP